MNYLKDFNAFIKPLTQKELAGWYQKTALITDSLFSDLARWSIKTKDFHSLGASVFAAPLPKSKAAQLVKGLVAFETLADFLDTLCDRSDLKNEEDFSNAHRIMDSVIALDEPPLSTVHPAVRQYVKELTLQSVNSLGNIPQFQLVKPLLMISASNYSKMQTLTHLPKGERERRCQKWFKKEERPFNHQITWWEFTASGGSTLTTFSLILAAHDPLLTKSQAQAVFNAYYPWMNGVNILLDSFIDQDEDGQTGDMNFMTYYLDQNDALSGICKFIDTAWKKCFDLPKADFHHFVLESMVKLYSQKGLTNPYTENSAEELLTHVEGLKSQDAELPLPHRPCVAGFVADCK